VVDLHLSGVLADLAGIREEPGEQPCLDLLGLGFRSGKPEEMIISISNISQPPVSRILRIQAGQQAQWPCLKA